MAWIEHPVLGRLLRQQCSEGLDANPDSVVHWPHPWDHRSGKQRWCRGWFPLHKADRGGIQYLSFQKGT